MSSILINDKKILYFIANIWNNDSNGIYDYTSTSIKSIKAYISESTYVVKTKNDIFLNIKQHADIQNENGDVLIFHVNNSINNSYILMNPIPRHLELNEINFEYINNKIWYVLKTVDLENHEKSLNCNEEYYLNQNDIIKIGKVKYAVQKIHLLQNDNNIGAEPPPFPVIETKYKISELNNNLDAVFEFVFPVKLFRDYINKYEKIINPNEKMDIYNCRYCNNNNINQETDDGENFLISVCKCKELVHYKCLKNYLIGLLEKKDENENELIYDEVMTFKDFECPTCHNQFPIKFKLPNKDKTFYLIDITEPKDCNFMILESIDFKQNDKYSKSIHIIKFLKKNGEPFTIGRDNDNDIIDRDISISRHHAILRFNDENGQITLQNWNSKYGTLVLVRKAFKILDKPIHLQVGKTYIEAKLINIEEYEKFKKEKIGLDNEKNEKKNIDNKDIINNENNHQ